MINKNNFLKHSKNKTENRNSVCYPNKKMIFHCSDEIGYTKEKEKNFKKNENRLLTNGVEIWYD